MLRWLVKLWWWLRSLLSIVVVSWYLYMHRSTFVHTNLFSSQRMRVQVKERHLYWTSYLVHELLNGFASAKTSVQSASILEKCWNMHQARHAPLRNYSEYRLHIVVVVLLPRHNVLYKYIPLLCVVDYVCIRQIWILWVAIHILRIYKW